MWLTKTRMNPRTPTLTNADKSISSDYLCSIHYFQMLNYMLNCLPDPLPPKEVMLDNNLKFMLFRSFTSIVKKLENV